MYNSVLSAFVRGIETCFVHVEADVSDGLPMFEMVGYLSSEVKEARERVRNSMKNSGIVLPPKRITINMSPANVRKEGTCFELAIAAAVLASVGVIDSNQFQGMLILGELSLNGNVNPVHGILPMVADMVSQGIHTCIVPKDNVREASIVQNVQVIGVQTVSELIDYFQGKKQTDHVPVNIEETEPETGSQVDFSDICGQENLKRASIIAAAGFHNMLMIGPPGAGKTMIAQRIPTILPDMTGQERIEITRIYSIMGMIRKKEPLISNRPFRAPHHTISAFALAGGGRIPRPGEVTLAHKGVLFLDELPEFQKAALEIMRQPLEEGVVHISRTNGTYSYPAHFMLVAAMNPCKCGYFPDYNRCRCTPEDVKRYLSKISRPLLDRIDMCVEAKPVPFELLNQMGTGESSCEIRRKVMAAREIQLARYHEMGIQFNSQLSSKEIRKYCKIGKKEQEFLRDIYNKLELTARSYHRILKIARTIADLEGEENISHTHICEAVSYRTIDRKFWTR